MDHKVGDECACKLPRTTGQQEILHQALYFSGQLEPMIHDFCSQKTHFPYYLDTVVWCNLAPFGFLLSFFLNTSKLCLL